MDALHEDKDILKAREREFCHAKGIISLDLHKTDIDKESI